MNVQPQVQTEYVGIRLDAEMKRRLDYIRHKDKKTASVIIREALDGYLPILEKPKK